MTWEIEAQHKNINSKVLVNEIDAYVRQRLDRISYVKSNNEHIQFQVKRLVSDLLNIYKENGKIENFKVICDKRNNTPELTNKGIFFSLKIRFKQTNCLNFTILDYRLK